MFFLLTSLYLFLCRYYSLFLIRCFKLFGKRNNLLVCLYQFNSVLFQIVKQDKCFLFRKIGMKFFHRLVIQYAYAPELSKQLGELDVIINLAFINPKYLKRLSKDTVLDEMCLYLVA